jgi:hypothetical protein
MPDGYATLLPSFNTNPEFYTYLNADGRSLILFLTKSSGWQFVSMASTQPKTPFGLATLLSSFSLTLLPLLVIAFVRYVPDNHKAKTNLLIVHSPLPCERHLQGVLPPAQKVPGPKNTCLHAHTRPYRPMEGRQAHNSSKTTSSIWLCGPHHSR